MRILILTKRQYTGKDLLDDYYGRLYEIPKCLAGIGHEVTGLALSYRRRPVQCYWDSDAPTLRWHSINALPAGLPRYGRMLDWVFPKQKPDVIWASSDILHIVLAAHFSRARGIPFVADLYDNYESFGMALAPGAKAIFRSACRKAKGLTVVSEALKDLVTDTVHPDRAVTVIGNAVRPDLFFPRDKSKSRAELKLPLTAKLIGSAGSITADRGVSDMFTAFERLAAEDEDVWLVHAGPVDRETLSHSHTRIINLGSLPLEQVPTLLAALDVAVICNRDSAFGRYCFPLKFYEAVACRTPLVAAAVGDVAKLLADYPQCRYTPGNPDELAAKIKEHLRTGTFYLPLKVSSWCDRANALEAFLLHCCSHKAGGPGLSPMSSTVFP
jgi:glycosyltransferase involved in cell wall biosynthesis